MIRRLPLLAALLATALPAAADVYAYRDRFGVIHLTDRPTDSRYRLVMRSDKSGRLHPITPASPSQDKDFHQLIRTTAQRYRLDVALLKAVVQVESNYDAQAVSKKGAVGLMQLMPGTASRYGVKNRHDPASNLDGGARYLRDLIQRFEDISLALAAYNAGENAVIKYGNQIPPYPETRKYVHKVLAAYRRHLGIGS